MEAKQKSPKTLRKRDKKRLKREKKDKPRQKETKPLAQRAPKWSESVGKMAKEAREGNGVTVPIGSDLAKELLSLEVVQTASNTIPIETTITQSFIWSFLIPAMTLAYMRGVSAEDDTTSLTYDALTKLTQFFAAVVQNVTSEVKMAPYFIGQYAAAVAQKTGQTKLGEAAFKFLLSDSGNAPPTAIPLNSHKFFMWVNTTTMTNGYFNQVTPVNGIVSQTWGNWFKYIGDATSDPLRLVSVTDLQKDFPQIYNDCSAFCGVYPQFTLPTNSAVGFSTQLFNASFIDRPLLASIVPYQDGGYSFARLFSSSLLNTGLQMLMNSQNRVTKTKVTPNFKYLDFGEFFEIYSIWLAKLLELFSIATQTPGASIAPYPVTAQQMAIMLRQDVSWALSPGVLAGEIPYDLPNTSLIPMLFGSNCFPTSVALPMPDVFVENIRALRATTTVLKVVLDGKVLPDEKSPVAFTIPILCVGSNLPWTNGWVFQDYTQASFPLYEPGGSEVAIDLIDCSINVGAIAVNVNGKLNSDKSLLLEQRVTPLAPYTYTISKLDQSAPATALRSLHYTRYLDTFSAQAKEDPPRFGFYDPDAPVRSTSKGKIEVQYISMPHKYVGQGVYDSVGPATTTCTHPFLAATYNHVIQTWWIPVANYALWPAQAITQNEDNRVDTLEKRKNNLSPIASLTSIHDDYVSKVTRGALADDSSLVTMVKEAAAAGRGGFFSSLLGNVAEQIFPGAKQIIDLLPV